MQQECFDRGKPSSISRDAPVKGWTGGKEDAGEKAANKDPGAGQRHEVATSDIIGRLVGGHEKDG